MTYKGIFSKSGNALTSIKMSLEYFNIWDEFPQQAFELVHGLKSQILTNRLLLPTMYGVHLFTTVKRFSSCVRIPILFQPNSLTIPKKPNARLISEALN